MSIETGRRRRGRQQFLPRRATMKPSSCTNLDVVPSRISEIYETDYGRILRRTDRLFAGLLMVQWFASMAIALWLTPHTWFGATYAVHIHVWAAIFLGGAIVVGPVALVIVMSGRPVTRHCIAAAQTLAS